MRILIANDTYFPDLNGAAYFTHRLAVSLKKRGHEVLVIAPSRSRRNEWSTRDGISVFGVRSIPIIHYTDFRFSPPMFMQKALVSVIREFRPDAVHLQGHSSIGRNVLDAVKKLGLKAMGTNHFMPENLVHYLHLPRQIEERLKRWAWRDFRRVFERLDLVTAPTHTAAGLMKKFGFSKPIQSLSNGIDLQKFRPGQDGGYLRERYGLPNRPTLLYVGRLDKEKNVDLVLLALALLDPKIAPHFLIAGKGFEEKRLKDLAKRLKIEDRVTFAGFVPDDDLPFLYGVADAFVIAGIAELQSLVTMEAMASGIPVIGVNATALPELIHDGENGYLFKEGDVKELAVCLRKMFSNKGRRERMGKKSLEIIRSHDIEDVVSTFESLYRKLSGETAPQLS